MYYPIYWPLGIDDENISSEFYEMLKSLKNHVHLRNQNNARSQPITQGFHIC